MAATSLDNPPVQGTPYYPDGDIILSAHHSRLKSTFLYRVHKIILAHHSPVFAGLFSLPSHPDVNETHDNIPVVRMPDEAVDLEKLLAALYDQGSLPDRDRDGDLARRLEGALRLSTKYQVDTVRNVIVRRIEADWPRTLVEWLAFQAKFRQVDEGERNQLVDYENDEELESLPEPVLAIKLAFKYNIPTILPAAFYLLSLAHIDSDWDREERWPHTSMWSDPHARWNDLESKDFVRLLKGQSKLFDRLFRIGHIIEFDHSLACPSEECKKTIIARHGVTAMRECYDTSRYRVHPDIFSTILAIIEDVKNMEIGGTCKYACRSGLYQQMLQVWDELPGIFGLPTDPSGM